MNDTASPRYSSFVPLVIFLSASLLWSGFQLVAVVSQRGTLIKQVNASLPAVAAAQNAKSTLYGIAQDLVQLGATDANAAQIVKDANIQLHKPDAAPAK